MTETDTKPAAAQNKELFHQDMKRAEETADQIKKLTLGQEFTIPRLSKLSGVPVKDCRQTIFFLSSFFLITVTGERMQEIYYRIVTELPVRIESIHRQIKETKKRFVSEINYLQMLEQDFISRSKEDPPRI